MVVGAEEEICIEFSQDFSSFEKTLGDSLVFGIGENELSFSSLGSVSFENTFENTFEDVFSGGGF